MKMAEGVEVQGVPVNDKGARSCSTLFVDGISTSVRYHQVRNLFAQYGDLLNVFVQRTKKVGRQFRFGFVRFLSWDHASAAIKAGWLCVGCSLS